MSIKLFKRQDKLELYFSGEDFTEIKDCVKEFGLKYNPDNRSWYANKNQVYYTLLPELESIDDDIKYYPSKDVIEVMIKPVKELKYYRRQFKPELLKFPTIQTKNGVDYQKEDIITGITQNRYGLFLRPGMGKSFESIVILSHLFDDNSIDKVLIVCPSIMRYTWKQELLKFFYKDLTDDDFYIVDTDNRKPFESKATFVIASYRNMVMISDDIYKTQNKGKIKKYRKNMINLSEWGTERCIVADELHFLANQSKQTQVIDNIKQYFEYRYGTTGTPITKTEVDLYNQLIFLDNNSIPLSRDSFIKSIANVGNRFSKYAINYLYPDKVEKFIESVKHYFVKREASDYLDLPEQYHKTIYVNLSKEYKQLYEMFISYELNIIKEEKGTITVKEVSNKFAYLSQIVHSPILLKGKIDKTRSLILWNLIDKWKFKDDCKLPIVEELLDEIINEKKEKVIICSQHPAILNELSKVLSKHNPIIIDGQIDIKDIDGNKDSRLNIFRKDKDRKILLANQSCIDVGITLTGFGCNSMIFWDNLYHFVVKEQVVKRINRISATEESTVYDLCYTDTIEIKVLESLKNKKAIDKEFANDKEILSKDEWKNFFIGK